MLGLNAAAVLGAANSDPELALRASGFTGSIRLEADLTRWIVRFAAGKVVACEEGGQEPDPDLVFGGTTSDWEKLLAERPVPLYVDPFIAAVAGMRLEGEPARAMGPYYGVLQRLIGVMRELRAGGGPAMGRPDLPWRLEQAVGKFVEFDFDGCGYEVYYEEAGTGIPLLLQHTAGADSRQWRHVLADPDVTRGFRVIAYDLPFHGYSTPPFGAPWWEEDYLGTKAKLMAWVVEISRALELDRPIFMGCSVGGQLAPDLLAHYPDEFRAAISINGWYHMDPFEGGYDNDQFVDPRISDEYLGSAMYGITTPYGPESLRREAHWVYASGGLGVYTGDNEYMMYDHDLREDGDRIDTARTPLYAIAGEYDPALAFPGAGAAAIAANISGAELRVFAHQSHFMMVDDPQGFRERLLPLLAEVKERVGGRSGLAG